MVINFAAVHDRNLWRKHSIHHSLDAAVNGKDGAKNLLLKLGRVRDMWRKHGDVSCVFVWEDGAVAGQAFRLDPERGGVVQSREIPIDKILSFQANRGCNPSDIAGCFNAKDAFPEHSAAIPAQAPLLAAIPPGGLYPDELPSGGQYVEGLAHEVLVNQIERSSEARDACIHHYGCVCQVCKTNFAQRYGELGVGFIHVHHRVPLASIAREYRVDPIRDLVPVCPNCHAMLHRREPPLEIDELREHLNDD